MSEDEIDYLNRKLKSLQTQISRIQRTLTDINQMSIFDFAKGD